MDSIIPIIIGKQRFGEVKWPVTYLKPQSFQMGKFQSYWYVSEAYEKHDMSPRVCITNMECYNYTVLCSNL